MTNFLRSVPNYSSALPVAEVDAGKLTEESFRRDYMDRLKPVLIRSACKHWPAMKRWRDLDYVRTQVGNRPVQVANGPLVEPDSPYNRSQITETTFDAVIERQRSDQPGYYLHVGTVGQGGTLEALAQDVTGFPFLKNRGKPRFYVAQRAFFYKDSYTDFHSHFTDETFMCQVKGAKEVLMYPPDGAFGKLVVQFQKANGGRIWELDPAKYPDWHNLRPYRVLVEEGDALYIPCFWFHGVESVGKEFGWTVAWCFQTPMYLFDPRLVPVRAVLKDVLFTRWGPGAFLAAGYSLLNLKRMLHAPYSA
jgi:hypothetical protein